MPTPVMESNGAGPRRSRYAFGSLLDLRTGEARPTLRAGLLLALLICGHTLLETARDALFLGKLPASRLALVYALIAGLALAVSAVNERFVRRFGEKRSVIVTLLGAALGTVLLYLQRPTPAIAFGIYVWSAFLGTVMVVQLWMFLARVFTPSQGKRIFGLIAAGGVIGAVIGASGAAAALAVVSVRSLLLGAAAAFVAALLLATTIQTADEPLSSSRDEHDEPPSGDETPSSTYVGWLTALTALSTAAVLGTDYLFKAEAARRIAPADLGSYFARSYAVFNAVALVVQVLVSGPLLRRLGMARSILVMPLLLVAGSASVLVTGAHAAVMVTKGVDGALRHSLYRVTSELLTLPIAARVRARVKPMLDGVLRRVVQAGMAGVIFVFAATGHGSVRELAGLVLVLTLGWLASAVAIRRPHLDMFRHAVSMGSLRGRAEALDAKLLDVIVEALSSREPQDAIAAMDLLADGGQERLVPSAVLFHESEEVQVHALDFMTRMGLRSWVPEAAYLLLSPSSDRVRVAALRALAAARAMEAVRHGLVDPSPAVRAHAAVALARAEPSMDPMTMPAITEILDAAGEPGRTGRHALLDALQDGGDPRFSAVILAMIDPGDSAMTERVVRAMASVRDPRFIPVYMQHLHRRSVRAAVRDALVDLGEPAQEALESALRDERTHRAVRLHIPRTLSRFGNQRAADFLTEQLAAQPSRLVRYKVLRGLGGLVSSSGVAVNREAILTELRRNLVEHFEALAKWLPLHDDARTRASPSGELLLGLLSDKVRQSLQRVFRLLHIAYRREDMEQVYTIVDSADRRGRSNAMEFLDALMAGADDPKERAIRDVLELAIDDLPPRQKVERAAAHVLEPPAGVEAALLLLIHDHDTSLAALATYHGVELGLERVREEAARAARGRPSLMDLAGTALAAPEVEHSHHAD